MSGGQVFGVPSFEEISNRLKSPDTDIATRMRALYQAKHHGGVAACEAIAAALVQHPSVLFRHEAVYTLGQLGTDEAIPLLTKLLKDETEHSMVRHEAAEALAAVGNPAALPVLQECAASPIASVRETCVLAIASLNRKQSEDEKCTDSGGQVFKSKDPIDRGSLFGVSDVALLRTILLDETKPLPDRYEALFSLRNDCVSAGNTGAEEAIVESLNDTSSALFRHEVAFVLGQILTPKSLPALIRTLDNQTENPMTRHEAAFAMGSILASPFAAAGKINDEVRDKTLAALRFHSTNDGEPIVFESCLVALDNAANS